MPVVISSIVSLLAAPLAVAHEGHGDPSLVHTVLHYLFEPVHAPFTVAALVAAAALAVWLVRRQPTRETQADRRDDA